jgi:hypothetical protein
MINQSFCLFIERFLVILFLFFFFLNSAFLSDKIELIENVKYQPVFADKRMPATDLATRYQVTSQRVASQRPPHN